MMPALRKVAVTCAALGVVGLPLLTAARIFGPVRPLDDVVLERLKDGGPASFYDHQPEISPRHASVAWEVKGEKVYVDVYAPDQPQELVETRTLGDIKAELVMLDPSNYAWRFDCDVDTLLYNFGSMKVVVYEGNPRGVAGEEPAPPIENVAGVVPEAHRVLRCG